MNKAQIKNSLLLLLTAVIWGSAFVAQSVGMDYVEPFTFTCVRSVIGGFVLIPCIMLLRKLKEREESNIVEPRQAVTKVELIGGICCGVALFAASNMQQVGILYTTVGKGGFITALYVVIVPIMGIFLKKKVPKIIWLCVALSVVGLYLLCMTGETFSLNYGDFLILICAVLFSFHIMIIDYFSPKGDGVVISCIQFFTCGILSAIVMFFAENPSMVNIFAAKWPILYAGVLSSGVAYTLQVVAQKNVNPTVASLILCLESVVSAIAGWLILHETLSAMEFLGCGLMFIAIVLAQIPIPERKKSMKKILSVALLVSALIFGMTYAADVFATEEKSVDIMFVHDTHSHLNEFATVENGETQVLGGFAKLKTLINEQKAENPDTLLLDAGDFAMGTLIQVMFEEEASEIRMLGELGIEATTLGNHEFDYKAQGLANMMNTAVESGDELPEMVVCNVDWETMEAAGLTEDQKVLKAAFDNYGVKDYIVTEKNGVKIAVIGVFGKDAFDCVPNCPLVFGDPVKAVKETVAEIKANEDVDMIACVSHCGTWEDEKKSEDEILAQSVPELDLIISGHTHTKLEEPIVHGNTYIVSASEYGKYLGDITMIQNAEGRWDMENYELILVDESIAKDPETQAKVDALMDRVDEKYLKQYGFTKDQILAYNPYDFATSQDVGALHTELNLGSIMADAYTYAVETMSDTDPHPVDVAVVPAGTVRDTYAKGNITTENVFNSFSLGIGKDGIPGYPLISVYLTGEELKLVAEIDSSISDLMTTARLYTDGLYWTYNPNRMILNKATDIYLCNQNEERVEIEDDKLYRVVTDFYSSQMLAGVTDLSYGLLKLEPKFADGTPVENFEDAIIYAGDQELKAWVAIAEYMDSFEDNDCDDIGEVPAKYDTQEGRKVVDDSKNIFKLINHLNKFTFLIIGLLCLVILLLVIIVLGFWTIMKKIIRKCRKK